MRFRYMALASAKADQFRTSGVDDFGNPVRTLTADSDIGYFCRHCLGQAGKGRSVLLGSYNVGQPKGHYWQPSPIFIHDESCPRFAGDEIPAALRDPVDQCPALRPGRSHPLRSQRYDDRRSARGAAGALLCRRAHALREHPHRASRMLPLPRRAALTTRESKSGRRDGARFCLFGRRRATARAGGLREPLEGSRRHHDRPPHVRGGCVVPAEAFCRLLEVTADDVLELLEFRIDARSRRHKGR